MPDYENLSHVYGFHVHEGNSCSGNINDVFAYTFSHYNPTNLVHPMHAGDKPSLFSNCGKAYLSFITDRFTVSQIIGKTVVVHLHTDDMMSQPSGNTGTKIAKDAITLVKCKDADVLPLTPEKYKRIMIVYVKGTPGPMDAVVEKSD